MLREIAAGLGLNAYLEPMPGPTRSDGNHLGTLPMVPSQGIARYSTFRGIYLTNPWVYAAVNLLAQNIGRLPLHVYALDDRARKQRIRGDLPTTPGRPLGGQALDRLLRNGFPMSRPAMFGGTLKDRLVTGNALWEIERDGVGSTPTGLARIKWRDIEEVREGVDGQPLFYSVRPRNSFGITGDARKILPGDVVHFGYGSDPESCYGISPLQSCKYTLALYDALMRHLVAYMGNSARPSGFISLQGLTVKKAQEVRDIITEMWASPENAGKMLVAAGKWERTGDAPDQAGIVELVHLSREEVAAAYNVPPPVLGILDRAIKSNVHELREQFVRDSLGHWASDFEGELDAQLLPQQPSWSNLFVEFQLAELLRPDLEARALVYQRMMPYFTIDEVRGIENEPALDIAGVTDVPWAPSGYLPLTAARGPRQPVAPAARELGLWLPPERD